jgi:metal transporter CNNM
MFLGFLTLDALDIRIKMQAAVDPAEREAAEIIYPLVNRNHRLLVTLLLMNAVAYECLPLFLDELMPTYLTILFSVTVLLVFGEILPSAIFTGEYKQTFFQICYQIVYGLIESVCQRS